MVYQLTNYGMDAATFSDVSPSMERLLNKIFVEEDRFMPANLHQVRLLITAEEKGYVRVI